MGGGRDGVWPAGGGVLPAGRVGPGLTTGQRALGGGRRRGRPGLLVEAPASAVRPLRRRSRAAGWGTLAARRPGRPIVFAQAARRLESAGRGAAAGRRRRGGSGGGRRAPQPAADGPSSPAEWGEGRGWGGAAAAGEGGGLGEGGRFHRGPSPRPPPLPLPSQCASGCWESGRPAGRPGGLPQAAPRFRRTGGGGFRRQVRGADSFRTKRSPPTPTPVPSPPARLGSSSIIGRGAATGPPDSETGLGCRSARVWLRQAGQPEPIRNTRDPPASGGRGGGGELAGAV